MFQIAFTSPSGNTFINMSNVEWGLPIPIKGDILVIDGLHYEVVQSARYYHDSKTIRVYITQIPM